MKSAGGSRAAEVPRAVRGWACPVEALGVERSCRRLPAGLLGGVVVALMAAGGVRGWSRLVGFHGWGEVSRG